MNLTGLTGVLNALTGMGVRASNQIVLLIVTLVAARFLTPADFGVFAIASTGVTLIRTLLYSGAFEYLLKSKDDDAAATECLIVNLTLATVVTAGLLGLSAFSRQIFGTAVVGALIVTMAPSNLLAAGVAWQESQVLRAGKLKGYYAVTAIGEFAAAGGAIALLVMGQGLNGLMAQLYIRPIVLLVGYLFLKRSQFSKKTSMARVFEVVRWSVSRYGGVVLGFITQYGADVLLGAFLSPTASGLYRASNRIVTAVTDMFCQPTRIIAATLFSARAAAGRQSTDIWPKVFLSSAFLGWAALAGLAVVSPLIVPVVLGPQWINAVPLVTILCLGRSLSIMDSVTGALLVSYDKQNALLGYQVITSALFVAALVAFAHFGPTFVSWITVVVGAAGTFGLLRLSLHNFPGSRPGLVKAIVLAILPPLAVAIAAYSAMQLMPRVTSWNIGQLAGVILTGVVAWTVVVYLQRSPLMDALKSLNPTGTAEAPVAETVIPALLAEEELL